MLNLYKLEIFNTVALEGSFSAAADRLLLSQPAVSQHIRDLEDGLGVRLFERGYQGVTLTQAGETLLDYTRCILRLVAEAENVVAGVEEIGKSQLAIGATPGASVHLLPEWIQSFHRRFPQMAVSLKTDVTATIVRALEEGKLDLGFIEGELEAGPPFHLLALRQVSLFVVVGRSHPWWDRGRVDIRDLDGQPFIARPQGSQTRAWVDQIFTRYGVLPHMVAEFDHPESIRQAVASGLGVGILPDWGSIRTSGQADIRFLPIEGADFQRILKLVWTEESGRKPASLAFLSHLTEEFPQLAQLVAGANRLPDDLPGRDAYRASLECSAGVPRLKS